MIFGAILAGGTGQRMGYTDMPKQFLPLDDKPIIIHTLEKFLACSQIDYIFIGVKQEWLSLCNDLIAKHIKSFDKIFLSVGGEDRNKTIINIIKDITQKFDIGDDDIIVTHDAVRPFLTYRILKENIQSALENNVCDTVISATDTIIHSTNNQTITEIPDRTYIFHGQTPQSFKINLFSSCYEKLTGNQKERLTDACKVFLLNGINVSLVEGSVSNMKITSQYDYKIAMSLVKDVSDD